MKGVSLYISLMVMGVLLALALGISAILFSQLKMMEGIGHSVMAFYASNTGIERTLYEISRGAQIGDEFGETLENGSTYSTKIIGPNGDCPAPNYCIKSVGIHKETRRVIRITR